jgi:hypothetical protein
MSNAATTLVSIERDIIAIMADIENGVSNTEEALLSRQQDRSEASSLLERRMAAMEAILASRRKVLEAQLEQQMAKPKIPDSCCRRLSLQSGQVVPLLVMGMK